MICLDIRLKKKTATCKPPKIYWEKSQLCFLLSEPAVLSKSWKTDSSRFIFSVWLYSKLETHPSMDASKRTSQLKVTHVLYLHLCVDKMWFPHKKCIWGRAKLWEFLQHPRFSLAVCVHILCCLSSRLQIFLYFSAMVSVKFSMSFPAYHTPFIEKCCHLIFIPFQSTMSWIKWGCSDITQNKIIAPDEVVLLSHLYYFKLLQHLTSLKANIHFCLYLTSLEA